MPDTGSTPVAAPGLDPISGPEGTLVRSFKVDVVDALSPAASRCCSTRSWYEAGTDR